MDERKISDKENKYNHLKELINQINSDSDVSNKNNINVCNKILSRFENDELSFKEARGMICSFLKPEQIIEFKEDEPIIEDESNKTEVENKDNSKYDDIIQKTYEYVCLLDDDIASLKRRIDEANSDNDILRKRIRIFTLINFIIALIGIPITIVFFFLSFIPICIILGLLFVVNFVFFFVFHRK